MKNSLFIILIILVSCKEKNVEHEKVENEITTIVTEDYELVKSSNSKALLILFPGGGTTSKETKEEFDILAVGADKNISVLLMNFNRHLWIDQNDSEKLTILITGAIEKSGLPKEKITIGGMSIGGNVALTLSNYLHQSKSPIAPEGVFIIDSPIDLYALFESAQKDLKREDFSEERLAEPRFIDAYFTEKFGLNDSLLANIQKVAPFTLATKDLENIEDLKHIKLRFYTEPDTLWWQENRQTDIENTNFYVIQKTAEILKADNWSKFELIQTKNKGYRANGERHPHSWSIADTDELTDWVLE